MPSSLPLFPKGFLLSAGLFNIALPRKAGPAEFLYDHGAGANIEMPHLQAETLVMFMTRRGFYWLRRFLRMWTGRMASVKI
jgi:hypothetical protein